MFQMKKDKLTSDNKIKYTIPFNNINSPMKILQFNQKINLHIKI